VIRGQTIGTLRGKSTEQAKPSRRLLARELLQRIGQARQIVVPDLDGIIAVFAALPDSEPVALVDAAPPNRAVHAAFLMRRASGDLTRRAPQLGRAATRGVQRVVRRRPGPTDT
jgi:hypothetical protein